MIKAALEYLLGQGNLAKRETTVELDGRTFLLEPASGRYQEVVTRSPDRQHAFGTVAALCDYLKQWVVPADTADATVLVSPGGIRAFLDEREELRRDLVTVPFFNADLPPDRVMTHEDLLLYLDQHEGKLEDEVGIRASLSIVEAAAKAELTCHDLGATTKIEMKATKGGVQSANPDVQSVKLPKYLTLTLRIGTREYEEPHRFRLKAFAEGGEILFRLIHLDRDQAVDRFLERCLADLRATLGEGWKVYQGA